VILRRLVLGLLAATASTSVARADVPAVAQPAPAPTAARLQLGPADPAAAIPIELPLLDAPYSFTAKSSLGSPSMAQSLALSGGAYSLMHGAVAQYFDPWGASLWRRWLGRGLVATADLLTMALPPFLAWQHEEWHRAVLSYRGMGSHNDVYDFKPTAAVIAVSHVKDEDLARLKAEHPAEQVRLQTAGIEGNYALAYDLERQAFFDANPAFNQVLVGLLYLSNSLYLSTCAGSGSDSLTDEQNAADGADVARRDFTGADCTGWVYDLHRPDEPYAARGVHPSGVGIDRYRRWSQLDEDERRYLRQLTVLSFLNFIDPYLFGVYGLELAREGATPLRLGFAIRHAPTSFGHVLRADVSLAAGPLQLAIQQQNYFNGERWLPGLDVTLVRYPALQTRVLALDVSARVAGWLQPARQRFDDRSAAAGGLVGVRLALGLHRRLAPYLELEAKSAGWVMGNVALERALALRAGAIVRVF
jgi:hypothetical protein